jgi:pyruvate/2-oxoglutarate/acetoin dehydrogenase E1 component
MTTVLESLNTALHRAFETDRSVHLLGEDVLDPYGGAFKVTRGLSERYPGRVITTPISEAGITGLAGGMALRGLRPVVEIMFGDFLTLAADQIVNHLAKFRWMYNDQVRVPVVIRTPMGGRRGYGPTHSQSLEKLFLGVPGLRVLAPAALGDPGALLLHAILESEDPLLFVENKLLYLLHIQNETTSPDFHIQPAGKTPAGGYRLSLKGAPAAQITLTAYGYMAELARQAALKLAYEHEIFAEIIVPEELSPGGYQELGDSARRTGRLLAIEEGTQHLGWGAEVLARALETNGSGLRCARRLAALDLPVPASGPLEAAVLPGVDEIVRSVQKML